ncbi:efflux RND transporter periplasmic adaptor subunit [Estrella lausannensis]|uniref:Peptidase n=1 Tax=Estrella lausannensis TaxID=483423 RepID=A0A0H5DRA9_9BACT|nr:efflux RND transporter periplasmic adaptor subunit [Estrella lausannensis]CRX38713.1 Peptidase [Estrella lausannensis]
MPVATEDKKDAIKKAVIPNLRTDIQLIPGPKDEKGQPMFQLYDPIRRKYFLIGWEEKQILNQIRPGMTYEELVQAIHNNTTLNINEEGLKSFFVQASALKLLEEKQSAQAVLKEYESKNTFSITQVFTQYLFFKLPLFNPDSFLQRTLPYVSFLASRGAFGCYGVVGIIGLFFLLTRFDQFVHTLTFFFNAKGFFAYALTLFAVKIIHEMSHAYTAAALGVRVPTMGVAFLVLWPVLYTDVTDSWRLTDRTKRIWISSAGIIAEMALAGFAMCLWSLTAPGILNSACFLVASSSLINTIFVNANPAMRYDGYYILIDFWGIDHLQQKAFSITRWQVREWLFGFGMPCPETSDATQKSSLILFAFYTIVYRLVVYTTVAVFVYYKFTKVLGILLFCAEIYLFIAKPVYEEIVALWKLKAQMKINFRSLSTLFAASFAVLFFVIPLPHTADFAAISFPETEQTLFVPTSGTIDHIYVKKGEWLNQGETIVSLKSREMSTELKSLEEETSALRQELNSAYLGENKHLLIKEKQQQYDTAMQRLAKLREIQGHLVMKADVSGYLYDWDNSLRLGQSVSKDAILGKIADFKNVTIAVFIPETDISFVSIGKEVSFTTHDFSKIQGNIIKILPMREAKLSFLQLSSLAHGDLPVVKDPKTGEYNLIGSYYIVYVAPANSADLPWLGKLGRVEMSLGYRSYLYLLLENVYKTLWRESNL